MTDSTQVTVDLKNIESMETKIDLPETPDLHVSIIDDSIEEGIIKIIKTEGSHNSIEGHFKCRGYISVIPHPHIPIPVTYQTRFDAYKKFLKRHTRTLQYGDWISLPPNSAEIDDIKVYKSYSEAENEQPLPLSEQWICKCYTSYGGPCFTLQELEKEVEWREIVADWKKKDEEREIKENLKNPVIDICCHLRRKTVRVVLLLLLLTIVFGVMFAILFKYAPN